AAHRFADRAESRLIAVGSRLSETRQPQQYQSRIGGRQCVVAQAPLLQRARTEVFDDDVGAASEPAHDLLALRRAQIRGDRFLVSCLNIPPPRSSVVQP